VTLSAASTCPKCKADLRDAEIPEESLHFYNHGPNGELIHSAEDYVAVRGQIENETTHFSRLIGVQYQGGYDGVSEWRCPSCGYREGRWSGRELTGDELEPRYGGPALRAMGGAA
jgi:rubredoxin